MSGITANDFFCGAGGSSTGMVAAGVEVKMAVNFNNTGASLCRRPTLSCGNGLRQKRRNVKSGESGFSVETKGTMTNACDSTPLPCRAISKSFRQDYRAACFNSDKRECMMAQTKYFVSDDGIGGVKIRLAGSDVRKFPQIVAVMIKAGYHEVSAQEYREACKKARDGR